MDKDCKLIENHLHFTPRHLGKSNSCKTISELTDFTDLKVTPSKGKHDPQGCRCTRGEYKVCYMPFNLA